MNRAIRYLISVTLIFSFFISVIPVQADQLQNAQAEKARLEQELSKLEAEIAQKQKELEGQKGQSVSLSRDITILTTQINKAKLDIKARNLTISKLGGEINQKNTTIRSLTEKIELEKESLAQLLRKNREIDDTSMVSLLLSKKSLSEAYGDVDAFSSLSRSIKDSVNNIQGIRTETEVQKKSLEIKKNQEIDTKVALENAKKEVEKNEANKKQLLSISKNKETEYQKILADKAKRKTEILAMLFGLRDTAAIPFGKALEYANFASEKTGVRPAFILAILTQESNLGTDQGSCYVTNFDTGAGVSSRSGKTFLNVMKPTRDIGPFKEITASVGRDPYKTLVSCPIGGYGYGGAMGPAQFIPSTWNLMKSRVSSALGKTAADPWNPRDAFMASAIYLGDLGAKAGTYTSEKTAACRYYGGGKACTNVTSPYGNSVMAKATKIQTTMIDPLQN